MSVYEKKVAELDSKILRQQEIIDTAQTKIKEFETKKDQLFNDEILDGVKALNMKPSEVIKHIKMLRESR